MASRPLGPVVMGLVCGPLLGVFLGCLLVVGLVDRQATVTGVLGRLVAAGVRAALGTPGDAPGAAVLWALLAGVGLGGLIPALALGLRAALWYWTFLGGPALLGAVLHGTAEGAWPVWPRLPVTLLLWGGPAVLGLCSRIYSR